SRYMIWDAAGNILEGDDGGIYRLTNPDGLMGLPTRQWTSLNGNLMNTEIYRSAYDSLHGIVLTAEQDNATSRQVGFSSPLFLNTSSGDGSVVAVDTTSMPGHAKLYFGNNGCILVEVFDRAYRKVDSYDLLLQGIPNNDTGQSYEFILNAIDPT